MTCTSLALMSYSVVAVFVANADQDYTGLPSMFSFVTGQSLSCILINITDDKIVESNETISLILQPPDSSSGVRISRGLSTVEIIDNDAGIYVQCFKAAQTYVHPIIVLLLRAFHLANVL